MRPRIIKWGTIACWLLGAGISSGQSLPLPPRKADAPGGAALVGLVSALSQSERESRLEKEFLEGNVPAFLRQLNPVAFTNVSSGETNSVRFFVTPDYLAVGSDDDYFLTPLSPPTAQRIANALGCSMPTRAMVDATYAAASVKLDPHPMKPDAGMTTVPVFAEHNRIVRTQRLAILPQYPAGALVAGHKKDVVLSNQLTNRPSSVAIYGWHRRDGTAIQPLYSGHASTWVDYSHGIRLVSTNFLINGRPMALADALRSKEFSGLLSDEGPLALTGYPLPQIWKTNTAFRERTLTFALRSDVRVQINEPLPLDNASRRPTKIILYALPNGNSIEETAGRKPTGTNEWRFDIQHIAAQTRFLRATDTNHNYVVAYLEASTKSWPRWRQTHPSEGANIREMVKELSRRYADPGLRITLTGHSGGGSFVFGFIGADEDIPEEIERIAFLDSTYAYDPDRHAAKLAAWLKSPAKPALSVLAYHDSNGLLNGKPFVSALGGTWHRSHLMQTNLADHFTFTRDTRPGDAAFPGDLHRVSALDGRILFWMKENPAQKIFHTVQVERNGFIETQLSGTALQGIGHQYFGSHAYGQWIESAPPGPEIPKP